MPLEPCLSRFAAVEPLGKRVIGRRVDVTRPGSRVVFCLKMVRLSTTAQQSTIGTEQKLVSRAGIRQSIASELTEGSGRLSAMVPKSFREQWARVA